MTPRKILICGLPSSGKTTLARELAQLLNATHYDGDDVRLMYDNDIGFSKGDRVLQAIRMRSLCDAIVKDGRNVVASFVCPTEETREMFGADYTVFMDTIVACDYQDTNIMFKGPEYPDWRVMEWKENNAQLIAEHIKDRDAKLEPVWLPHKWDWTAPTGLVIGRFQPFHLGHKALVAEALRRYPQVLIGVRTMPPGPENPFTMEQAFEHIHENLAEYGGRVYIMSLPNIASVLYGRDVGYKLERVKLDKETESISATEIRKREIHKCGSQSCG